MAISLEPAQVLALALQSEAAGPRRQALHELSDHLVDEALPTARQLSRPHEPDFSELLDLVYEGLGVIASADIGGHDVEEPLTEAIGPYYAEPLHRMVERAQSGYPDTYAVIVDLRAFIDALRVQLAEG